MTPEETILKANKAIDLAFLEVSQRRNTRQYAEDIKNKIITRTKLGFGVDPSGKQLRFKPLSESYKEQRKGRLRFFKNKNGGTWVVDTTLTAKTFNSLRPSKTAKKQYKDNKGITKVYNLDQTTTPSKSNLTATGLLLRSISSVGKTGQMIISLKNKVYEKGLYRERPKSIKTTSEVFDYVSKIRPFFGLTNPQFNLLFKDIAKEIDRIARLYIER